MVEYSHSLAKKREYETIVYRDNMVKEQTGELIKRFRELRGLSQRKLAELSGVDRGYINQLEKGRGGSISLRVARALAESLEILPEIFLRTEDEILERLDSEVGMFFTHDWPNLNDDEKDWVKWTIRMIRERRREREQYKAAKERERQKYELPK